ncbi:hypothetical protein V2J09_007100 [Rumex salicifolius]
MARRCRRFSGLVEELGLLHLGFSGPRFTWSQGEDIPTHPAERLDKALCSVEWRILFEDAAVRHLARLGSDHAPILINTGGFSDDYLRHRPFRFQAAWLLYNKFQQFLVQNWNKELHLSASLANLSVQLSAWNRKVFVNMFRRRNRLWRRLEGVQCALCGHPTPGLIRLEYRLRSLLSEVLEQIHIINTKFFHVCVIVRRKRNCIESLQDANGVWFSD